MKQPFYHVSVGPYKTRNGAQRHLCTSKSAEKLPKNR